MSYSQANICNIALGHLGVNRLITNLDTDLTPQGQACRTHYALALDTVLKAYIWPFAQRQATLAAIAGYTAPIWAYAYRSPTDLLLAHVVNRSDGNPSGEQFEVGGDATGGVIYTHADAAVLDYTSQVIAPGLYPADFVEALAYQLAMRVAMPLAAEGSLRAAARSAYIEAITLAMTSAGNGSRGQEQPADAFLAARGAEV